MAPMACMIRLAIAGSALALAGWQPPALAQTAAAPRPQAAQQRYDIPPGPLSAVLARFVNESGVLVAGAGELAQGKNSPGVSGTLEAQAALNALLAGTGLKAAPRNAGSYVLERIPGAAAGGVTMLDSVTVTGTGETTEGTGSYITPVTAAATGLKLSPRETPQSVSVVTRQRIDDQSLQDLGSILQNTTGISTLQLDSERTIFSARGFPIEDLQYDGISTYYKSNYAAGESELDSVLYDRVEVVRGATGLLTGAGQPSASVNLVRKRADSRTFKGEATISAGSWDNYRGTLDLSTPVTSDGRIRTRLVASHEDKKSFFDRYERKRSVFYGVVEADLTPRTTLAVGGSYQKSDAEGLTYGGVPLWYTDGSRTSFRRSFTVAPKWNWEEVEVQNIFANLDHRFSNGWNAQLRLMHSRSDVDNARLFVWGFPDRNTGQVADTPSLVRFPGYREQNSADARLSGPFSLAGREHEAVLGVSYLNHKYSFDWIGASTAWNSPFNVSDFGSVPEPEWDYGGRELSERNHTKQAAVYGALRLSLTDDLKLILGGRYTHYDREGAGWASSGQYQYSDGKFVPYAGVVYDLNPTYSVYASYTSIFNYQDLRDRSGNWLAPVTGKAYETGIKGEYLDGRVNASLALFRIEQDNLAQADVGYLVPGTTETAYYGADGATSRGIEFELAGEVARGWQLFLGATRFIARDTSGKDVNTERPRTLLRLFTTYQLPGEWHRLTVGGGVNWQSRVYYENVGPNGERQQQGGYAVASLLARYQFTPDLSAQLNVNNVFDKKYQRAVNWYGQGIWGTPAEVMATLRYRF
jgi:outer membrane receptor for ferric coprogen and ferric-rhodotorulic acid